jgi:nucleoside-diphosphate-sugar epimerase
VPKILIDAALEGRPLQLPAGGDVRVDHVNVADTVQGVLLALDQDEHPFDVYNIATGQAPSLAEIVAMVWTSAAPASTSATSLATTSARGSPPRSKQGATSLSSGHRAANGRCACRTNRVP